MRDHDPTTVAGDEVADCPEELRSGLLGQQAVVRLGEEELDERVGRQRCRPPVGAGDNVGEEW